MKKPDLYIGGPPQVQYRAVKTFHSDRPADYPLDLNEPLRIKDYSNELDNLERTLEYIWRNDAGFSWSEIYLQLLGLWHYYAGINKQRRDDIRICQLIAQYRVYNP